MATYSVLRTVCRLAKNQRRLLCVGRQVSVTAGFRQAVSNPNSSLLLDDSLQGMNLNPQMQLDEDFGALAEQTLGPEAQSVSLGQWSKVRQDLILGTPEEYKKRVLDASLLRYFGARKSNLWLSYIEYLDNARLFTPGSLRVALHLCSTHYEQVPEELFLRLTALMESAMGTTFVYWSFAIEALSFTKRWEECFDLLPKLDALQQAKAGHYSYMAAACFRNGRCREGFDLLATVCKRLQQPLPLAHIEVLRCVQKWTAADSKEKALDLLCEYLQFLRRWHLYPDTRIAEQIKICCQKLQMRCKTLQEMEGAECCPLCDSPLEPHRIDPGEFRRIKTAIVGSIETHIFKRSHPAEWTSFKRFLAKAGSFDVVVDALNLSYFLGANRFKAIDRARVYQVLRQVLLTIRQKYGKKRILMISRRHFFKPSQARHKSPFNELTTMYFVEDVSHDDAFMLYASLASGPGCYILSNDRYRDFVDALPFPEAHLAAQWLHYRLIGTSNRHRLAQSTSDALLWPSKVWIKAQESSKKSGVWHVPFYDDRPRILIDDLPKAWLCIAPPGAPRQPKSQNENHD